LQRWGQAKARSRALSQHIRTSINRGLPVPPVGYPELHRVGTYLAKCGDWLELHRYPRLDQVRLVKADFCNLPLLCPLCAIRRAGRSLRRYVDRIRQVLAEWPEVSPYLVTLTVKNGPDLAERVAHLRSSHRALLKARIGTRQVGEVRKAYGGVYSFEVTNNGNGWHPHVHAVWLCADEPERFALSDEWRQITGDSMIIDVRPMADNLVGGCVEVLKYALKASSLPLELQLDAWAVLRGRRLVSAFGCLYGLQEAEQLADEPLVDEPYEVLFYRFFPGLGYRLADSPAAA
jgi:hypothetical protein